MTLANRPPSTRVPKERTGSAWPMVAALLLLGLPYVFWGLGAAPIIHGDEALYLGPVVEMEQGGPTWIPTLDGEAFFVKAPLSMWLIRAARFVSGSAGLGAARSVSALAALATVLIVAHLASCVYGSRRAGFLAGFVLLLNPAYSFLHCARYAEPDALANLFLVCSLWAYHAAQERGSIRHLILAGAAAGAAAMAKSLALGLLPLVAIGAAWLFAGGRRRLPWTGGFALLLGFALVAGPLHVSAYASHGQGFLSSYFFDQTLGRLQASTEPTHWSPMQVFAAWHVTAVFVLVGIVSALGAARRTRGGGLLLAWVAIVALAVATVQARLPWYIFPAYPALAVFAGGGLEWMLEHKQRALVCAVGALAFVTAIGMPLSPNFRPFHGTAVAAADSMTLASLGDNTASLFWLAATVLGLCLAAFWARERGVRGGRVWAVALLAPLCVPLVIEGVTPLFRREPMSPLASMLERLQVREQLGQRALYHGRMLPSLVERATLSQAYSSTGGSCRFTLANGSELLVELEEGAYDRYILPAMLFDTLRSPLEESWAVLDVARSPGAQLANPEGLVLILAPRAEAAGIAPPADMSLPQRALLDPVGAAMELRRELGSPTASLRPELLQAAFWQGSPALRDPLEATLAEREPRSAERPALLAVLARLGSEEALEEPWTLARKRPRLPARSHLVAEVLARDDGLQLVALLSHSGLASRIVSRTVWLHLGQDFVLRHLADILGSQDEPMQALGVALFDSVDGRVLALTAEQKRRLRDYLVPIAERHGQEEVRSGARRILGLYLPGIWVPWVPDGGQASVDL